jgi:hypothetical protein
MTNQNQIENLIKAQHDAKFALGSLVEAAKEAAKSNPLLALVLTDLVADQQKITARLDETIAVLK